VRKHLLLIAACTVSLGLSSLAWAGTTFFFAGQSCQWGNGSEWLGYSPTGAWNGASSGSASEAFCPIGGFVNSNAVVVDSASVTYTNWSGNAQLLCKVGVENWDGSSTWSATLYSCPTDGGCPSPDANAAKYMVRNANLTWPDHPVGWSTFYAENVYLDCWVPHGSGLQSYNATVN
jgi:hypothetical protein